MSPAEVLGLEIKQYGNEEIKTLVPRIVGKTTNAEIKKEVKQSVRWTLEAFSTELRKKYGQESVDIATEILKRIEDKGADLYYGYGRVQGIITPYIVIGQYSNTLFAVATYGKIEIHFQHLKNKPPFTKIEMRQGLLKRLNDIKGMNIPEDGVERRPSFLITILNIEQKLNSFLETFYWVIDEVKKAQEN